MATEVTSPAREAAVLRILGILFVAALAICIAGSLALFLFRDVLEKFPTCNF